MGDAGSIVLGYSLGVLLLATVFTRRIIAVMRTEIGDTACGGAGTELVAPLTISADTVIGPRSTITKSVPPRFLALASAGQRVVEKKKRTEKTGPST